MQFILWHSLVINAMIAIIKICMSEKLIQLKKNI